MSHCCHGLVHSWPESCSTVSLVFGSAEVQEELIQSQWWLRCSQPLSASRLTKLQQMTAEVWLAEGLDALTLARCSPLSPKTNRVLHHPAQQLPSADTSLCADGPSASGALRGPPSSVLIVWIRCTRGRCLSFKNNLPDSSSVSSHLVQQINFFYCHAEFLFVNCSLSSR